MIYNSGNWGIPLMTLAFPGQGGVLQVFVLATMNMTTFTAGVFLANSSNHESPTSFWKNLLPVFKQPSIYAIALAIVFRIAGNPLDGLGVRLETVKLCGQRAGWVCAINSLEFSYQKPSHRSRLGRLGWALGIRLPRRTGHCHRANLAVWIQRNVCCHTHCRNGFPHRRQHRPARF